MAARLGEDFLYICHMTPFISIIIPFYGTADPVLLQRCITSIREQGMEEGSYEIIVADDNGKGLGGARNRGIGRATVSI
ncbi:MAG: glycosyltransferase family 2 protein [Bacteroides cellulosilyticus]